MDEFNTLEKVKKLFFDQKIKDSDDNIYLALLSDTRKNSGMAGGMEYPYNGLLLCITPDGVAYYYLKSSKFSLKISLEKLVVDHDSFTYLDNNNNIKSIEVKKFALLDKMRKELIIKTNDKKTHYLYGLIEDNTLPYHNNNMSKLIEKYEQK